MIGGDDLRNTKEGSGGDDGGGGDDVSGGSEQEKLLHRLQ